MNYIPIFIKCEICGKECKGLIGLSSHISQSKNHPKFEEYMNLYSIDNYIKEQMKKIFLKSFIKDNSGCWLWNDNNIDKDGYGIIYAFGKRVKAHRFSYELYNGEIGDNLNVCHKCDIPKCVNPEHLWLGTSSENTQDSVNKNRRLTGDKNPSKREDVREKISKALKGKPRPSMIGNTNNKPMFGDDNPMRNPDIARKCVESRRKNNDK